MGALKSIRAFLSQYPFPCIQRLLVSDPCLFIFSLLAKCVSQLIGTPQRVRVLISKKQFSAFPSSFEQDFRTVEHFLVPHSQTQAVELLELLELLLRFRLS